MCYENEDCRILYNLWSQNGSMGFIFENKTDKDLFIDMTQTFFIKNGAANDYFRNQTYESRTSAALSLGYSVSESYLGIGGYWPTQYIVPVTLKESAKAKLGLSTAVTTKESEYICVPAKSFKVISYYEINPQRIITCDKKIDYPHTQIRVEEYGEQNTPLKFKNRIAYSFKKGENLRHIENSFWLNEIRNYSRNGATELRKEKKGCSNINVKNRYFKIGGPDQFYILYEADF